MGSLFRVGFMSLQGMSTVIIDWFYVFAALIAFLSLTRFSQFNQFTKVQSKKPRLMLVEGLVQGIGIGVVMSFLIGISGLPVMFTEYLYLILPLSFLIGFYHVRLTNMVYAVLVLSLVSLVFNGQTIGTFQLPQVEFDSSGMAIVTGLLLLSIGLILSIVGTDQMMPLLVKKEEKVYLGYASYRFWPIPLVLLVAVPVILGGNTLPMPAWWPLVPIGGLDVTQISLLMLPLLLVTNHCELTFNDSPKKFLKQQGLIRSGIGLLLLIIGLVTRNNPLSAYIVPLSLMVIVLGEGYYRYRQSTTDFHGNEVGGLGAVLLHVQRHSTAHRLGFLDGDVIISINAELIQDKSDIEMVMPKLNLTDKIMVSLIRDQVEHQISLTKEAFIHQDFGAIWLPKQYKVTFDYEDMKNMGMMHMIKYKHKMPFDE